MANHTTPSTATSSVTLAAMLVTGSGEELIASRLPALTEVGEQRGAAADDRRAPPGRGEEASPASRTPITAPTVGRIAVEIASHVESM